MNTVKTITTLESAKIENLEAVKGGGHPTDNFAYKKEVIDNFAYKKEVIDNFAF